MTGGAPAKRLVLPGRFRAVVFDMDGILLDTEPQWYLVFQQVAARFGGRYAEADRAATMGQPLNVSAAYIAQLCDADAATVAQAVADGIESRYLAGAPAVTGARELVGGLAGRLPMAVATNTIGVTARRALAASGFDAFQVVVSGADLEEPKPRPGVYLEACRRLGVAPAEAVAFEDTAVGIRSALDAGLTVVGVPQDGLDLRASGAHVLLGSLEDVTVEA